MTAAAYFYICDGDIDHPVLTHKKMDWPDKYSHWQEIPLVMAQPEQEPVAIPDCGEAGHADGACGNRECLPSFNRNTTPSQRKPLSDEEILTYRHMIDWTAEWSYINFARAIEAAHGIGESK